MGDELAHDTEWTKGRGMRVFVTRFLIVLIGLPFAAVGYITQFVWSGLIFGWRAADEHLDRA